MVWHDRHKLLDEFLTIRNQQMVLSGHNHMAYVYGINLECVTNIKYNIN